MSEVKKDNEDVWKKEMGEEVQGLPEFLSDKGQRELPWLQLPRAMVDQMAKGKSLSKD